MRRLLPIAAILGLLMLGAGGVANNVPYSTTASGGVEKSAVVCSSGCNHIWTSGWNDGNGTRYVMLFDATSLPANGAIPIEFTQVATVAPFEIKGPAPERFKTGLVVACSSTAKTLTIVTANDCFFHVLAVQ